MHPLHRQLHPHTTTPPSTDHAPPNTLDFRSSDATLDRYHEVIAVSGWKLDNYRKNPVFQNAHSYGSLADTIGKALITEIRYAAPEQPGGGGGAYLFQRVQFAVEENPMAKLAYGLYKGGFLRAVSVGFIPLRWEDFPSATVPAMQRRYLEQELLEVSAVSIPANPNALTLGLEAGAIEKADLQALIDFLKHTTAQPAPPDPLLALLHELRTLFRRA